MVLRVLMIGLVLMCGVGCESGQAVEKDLPRVLLIGDSICSGYYKKVKLKLAGRALVVKQKGNAKHTWNGMEKLDSWLGDEKWDVIHFNWGLWDLAHRNPKSKNFGHLDKVDGTLTTSLEDYEANLWSLVKDLKATGAVLIWATTTPVPAGEPGRIQGDAKKYNAVALEMMKAEKIRVNDLHQYAADRGKPSDNNVHTLPDLSVEVVRVILEALEGSGK